MAFKYYIYLVLVLADPRLNILFLCSWYPHPGDPTNGIFIRRHARALARQHQVTVLYIRSGANVAEETVVDLEEGNLKERMVYLPKQKANIPFISKFIKYLHYKAACRKYVNNLPGRSYDIIHVNVIFPAVFPALYALKKYPQAALFITEHWSGYYPADGNYSGAMLTYYTKQLVRKAKAVFVVSRKMQEAMEQHGLKTHYELINNVVDTEVFKPIMHTPENGNLSLLHVSSLVNREKNITGILNVIYQVKKHVADVKLTVVGRNDAEIKFYEEQVKNLSLTDNVKFEGYKTPAEIAAYMQQADLFVLFSHFESMPVVLLEAMACGLPVITTPVGEVKAMVAEGMGIVLNGFTEAECAEKIVRFNENKLASTSQMHAYIHQQYSPEAVCEKLTTYYRQLK